MSKLFLRVARQGHGPRRAVAWLEAQAGAVSLCRQRAVLSEAQAQEFGFCESRGIHETMGAGGQYVFKVYERTGDMAFPYAIVYPAGTVRERYPNACRVVNLATGVESGLMNSYEEASAVMRNAKAGKLLGSFDCRPTLGATPPLAGA